MNGFISQGNPGTVAGPSVKVSAAPGAVSAAMVGPCVDRAGVVAVTSKVAGELVHVSFSAAQTGFISVQVTPMNAAAAKCGLCVTAGSTSFTVHAAEVPADTVTFSYSTIGVLG